MKKVEKRRHYGFTMALMNLLRDIPNKVVQMMMDKGYTRVLTVEERTKMAEDVKAFTDELYGEKAVKEKKAKPQVVQLPPATIDRAYLETLTVSALKQLGKDCPRIKGRKPRPEIIEILLQELGGASSPVAGPAAASPVPVQVGIEGETTDDASSDDELRAEVPPAFQRASATVSTAEVAEKKTKAKAAKAPKAEKPKAEKPPKEKKEKKTKAAPSPVAAPAAAPEEEEEQVLTVKEWFHPNDMSKPKEERTKYYIDPATNYIYDPEDTEEPMGQWDEATKEIIPV